jgi:hypothetical protein
MIVVERAEHGQPREWHLRLEVCNARARAIKAQYRLQDKIPVQETEDKTNINDVTT